MEGTNTDPQTGGAEQAGQTSEHEEQAVVNSATATEIMPETAESAAAEAPDDQMTDMAELLEAESVASLRRGNLLRGVVMEIGTDGIMVDIGQKSEGLVPTLEIGDDPESISPGDTIEVYVLQPETEDGLTLLSKRRADYEKLWRDIQKAHETGDVIEAFVKDAVKGGLIVDVGVDGFVPASHASAGPRPKRNLESMIGRTLRLRVIEVDKRRNKVILSHRLVVEEERDKARIETFSQLEVGKAVEGVVRRITDFGAFVDLGGVDGLLHISEMAWSRVKHPSDVLAVGDKIQVVILDWDRERDRISLGRKQLLPDPWKEAVKKYRVGEMVKVKITRLIPNGAFAFLEAGIEGIIPVSELTDRRINEAREVISVGDEVNVRVLQIRPQQRRITFSLKEAQQEQERREYRDFMNQQETRSNGVTIGDMVGSLLTDAAGTGNSEPAAPADEEPVASSPTEPSSDAAVPESAADQDERPGHGGDEPGETWQ